MTSEKKNFSLSTVLVESEIEDLNPTHVPYISVLAFSVTGILE